MNVLKFTMRPLTAFGTPLAGDTLFGHLCWAIRERNGESGLARQLEGYTAADPFVVISDGFPEGLIPRPTAPDFVLGYKIEPSQRKRARTHRWLPASGAGQPMYRWVEQAAQADASKPFIASQNTINRLTGTTGTGQFAPRQVHRIFFDEGARLDIYAVLDEARLSRDDLRSLLADIGLHGYGRDATTGLGKFEVIVMNEHTWPTEESEHWLHLPHARLIQAPSMPMVATTFPLRVWATWQPCG